MINKFGDSLSLYGSRIHLLRQDRPRVLVGAMVARERSADRLRQRGSRGRRRCDGGRGERRRTADCHEPYGG